MAGIAGFEPAHTGVKGPGLTAWRYPCISETRFNHVHGEFLGLLLRVSRPRTANDHRPGTSRLSGPPLGGRR